MPSCTKAENPATGQTGSSSRERCPTAAWDMQKFWYNVTKAGEVKYNVVQITRNGNGAA